MSRPANCSGSAHLFLVKKYIVPEILPSDFHPFDPGRGQNDFEPLRDWVFLGIGLQPPLPEWGSMVNQGIGFLSEAPWLVAAPGAMIFLTVFGFQLLAGQWSDNERI